MSALRLHPVWLPDGSAVAMLPPDHEIELTPERTWRAKGPDWTGAGRSAWRDAANDASYRFAMSIQFPMSCSLCSGIGRRFFLGPDGAVSLPRCPLCDGCARSIRGIDSMTPVLLWSARVNFVWPPPLKEAVRGLVRRGEGRRPARGGPSIDGDPPLSYSAAGAFGRSRGSLS